MTVEDHRRPLAVGREHGRKGSAPVDSPSSPTPRLGACESPAEDPAALRGLVRKHITPALGPVPIADIPPARVRTWRAAPIDSGVSPTTTAKAYRLLRTVLATAVDDRLIRANPCGIRGAAIERPTPTVDQVFAVTDGMPSRYRALVLLATFASLRCGELAALQRRHLDLEGGFVDIRVAVVELGRGQLVVGPPKTAAGRRIVATPSELVPDMRRHLAEFVGPAPDALVFAGPLGAPLRRSNFSKFWGRALGAADIDQACTSTTGRTPATRSRPGPAPRCPT